MWLLKGPFDKEIKGTFTSIVNYEIHFNSVASQTTGSEPQINKNTQAPAVSLMSIRAKNK